jgi:3-hydroxy-3-methylglutaryl CoA synthase/uncharacterized OB-fold protein
MTRIVSYGTYLPAGRVARAEMGAGKGSRIVASYDEDSTTMGVAAGIAALGGTQVASLYFATTSPSYVDKTNATGIAAALGLGPNGFAVDMAGSARSGFGALRTAAATGGLAVLADVRTGLPGSTDERAGGDGAAAFLFSSNTAGDAPDSVAEVLATDSVNAEFLDRWRDPLSRTGKQWEERFGLEEYLPLVDEVAKRILAGAAVAEPDHVVITSPNPQVAKKVRLRGRLSTVAGSPIGHAGAADIGLGLAAALDAAGPGETVLALSAADGVDAILLRTTATKTAGATAIPDGRPVPYLTYLNWRGLLDRQPPRRPVPEAPAGPPSARTREWKFAFTGSRCENCGFVHLPPSRVCKGCGTVDKMAPAPLSRAVGAVATYTVDRLAFSPSPPMIDAVVDFDGGGRYTLEMADTAPEQVAVGTRVELTFRRLFTADGVHNYFWKARPVAGEGEI